MSLEGIQKWEEKEFFKVGLGPITSAPPATSVTVSQSRQPLPPRQCQSANHVSPSRHVSLEGIQKWEEKEFFKVGRHPLTVCSQCTCTHDAQG